MTPACRHAAVLSICLLTLHASAQTPSAPPTNSVENKSIHQMFLDDQSEVPAGKPGGVSPITFEEFKARSIARRQRVRLLLANGDVSTGEDFHDAALLFQHGENPDDYLFAHILATAAVVRGDDSSKWLVAATLDRYLQSIEKPQVFGTQYPLDPQVKLSPQPSNVGRFRGRTQAPFNDALLPDSLRHDFCVPDLAQQKKNLATLNAGSYPGDAMVVPGCKR